MKYKAVIESFPSGKIRLNIFNADDLDTYRYYDCDNWKEVAARCQRYGIDVTYTPHLPVVYTGLIDGEYAEKELT